MALQRLRLIKKRLIQSMDRLTQGNSKRAYTKKLISQKSQEAYEVVCGVAGCVLKKKDTSGS
ncbi:hypothetical protein MY494_05435 [Synechococcus sp. A10-1-5-1]|uniref:hypothetical protein n=1 Tax=Synechococcus sp. A10-1-5-1 TaxID=2936507 RepID=UPI002001331E|nr:hypothetical protein [Synechococcus sp. A10-1-5-1]UPM51201.1 hypothetical protein MY494_05435 [Synechococcus sp. A10-1-5-1]